MNTSSKRLSQSILSLAKAVGLQGKAEMDVLIAKNDSVAEVKVKAGMMTFAHAQKYFATILDFICDCSLDSSKNRANQG